MLVPLNPELLFQVTEKKTVKQQSSSSPINLHFKLDIRSPATRKNRKRLLVRRKKKRLKKRWMKILVELAFGEKKLKKIFKLSTKSKA